MNPDLLRRLFAWLVPLQMEQAPLSYEQMPAQLADVMQSPFVQDTIQYLLGGMPRVEAAGKYPLVPEGTAGYVYGLTPDLVSITPLGLKQSPEDLGETILHEGLHTKQFSMAAGEGMMSPDLLQLLSGLEGVWLEQDEEKRKKLSEMQSYALQNALEYLRNRSGYRNPDQELQKFEAKYPGTAYAAEWADRMLSNRNLARQ